MTRASLTIVGTGIAAGSHLTIEARASIEAADEVLYLVTEPLAAASLDRLNPNNRSLLGHYREGIPRTEIYQAMARDIVDTTRSGKRVCAAFYGHPGVFVRPAHEAIRQARAAGIEARMLPAVSALDCLFADLGVDPADVGLQSYEATEFLLHGRRPDTSAALALWQLHLIGQTEWAKTPENGLALLTECLLRWYPADHRIVMYEASPFPIGAAAIDRLTVERLGDQEPAAQSTLYVPAAREPQVDAELAARLGMPAGAI